MKSPKRKGRERDVKLRREKMRKKERRRTRLRKGGSKKKKTPKSNHKRSKRGLRRKEKSDLEVEATGQPIILGDISRS